MKRLPMPKEVFPEVKDAIKIIKERKLVNILRKCRDKDLRCEKLMGFFPEAVHWSIMSARQLIVYLQRKYTLDFGVCPYYEIEGDKQYCRYNGRKAKCLCTIPQPECEFRDEELRKVFLPDSEAGVAY